MSALIPFDDLDGDDRRLALIRAGVILADAVGYSLVRELADRSAERHPDAAAALRWLINDPRAGATSGAVSATVAGANGPDRAVG